MSAKAPNRTAVLRLCLACACAGGLLTLAACSTGALAPTTTPVIVPTHTVTVLPTDTSALTPATDTPVETFPIGGPVPTQDAETPIGTPADAVITATTSAAIRADNAAQVVLLQTVRMGKPVDRIAFSDKTTNPVAAGREGKSVHVWTKPGTAFVTLAQPEKTVTSLSFTPDGHTLAAGSEDGRVYVWSLTDLSGKPRQIDLGYSSGTAVDAAALSPDGTLLATLMRQHEIQSRVSLVTVADGKPVATLPDLPQDPQSMVAPQRMAFTPDGKMLAVSDEFGMLGVYSVPDGKLLRSWQASGGKGHEALAWSPDGTRLATTSGDRDNDVHIWSTADGALLADLHPDVVDRPNSFAWSPDGSLIAIGSYGTPDSPPATFMPGGGYFTDIALVRTSDGQHLQRLHGHIGAITDLAISADGRLLVSASDDGTLRFWGVR